MGSSASSLAVRAPEKQSQAARARQQALPPPSYSESCECPDVPSLDDLESALDPPVDPLARDVLLNGRLKTILPSRETHTRDTHFFSTKLDLEGSITDQKSSGRCWIFSACSVMRLSLMKKYDLEEFELSENYIFFFDKLEKANYFLEKSIETASLDADSRLVQSLFSAPVNDGGQWDMIINVVTKVSSIYLIFGQYGVLPKQAFPETHHSSASSELNWIVTKKLREFAITLRGLVAKGVQLCHIRAVKKTQLSEIYRILATTLSVPPKTFTWEFRNKKGQFYRFDNLSPVSFYETHVKPALANGQGVAGMISLVHDPRHDFHTTMTVDHLGNVVNGRSVTYWNVPIEEIKAVAVRVLQSKKPVWFGCDVGQFFDSAKGIMDLDVFAYTSAFKTDVIRNMSKADRLTYRESLMTHAMVLTGVDLVSEAGKLRPSKWRVQNSWGVDAGRDGYNVMSSDWFDEFVYQIVVERDSVPKEVLCQAAALETVHLPLWDPLGSLA